MTESSVSATPPDESSLPFDFLTWFEIHRTRIFAVAGCVTLGVVVFLFFRWQREQGEISADQELMRVVSAASPAGHATSSALLAVAEAHRGTRAAERAQLLAAGRLFSEGKYAEAQLQFDKFNTDFPDSAMAITATFGVATSLDAQNKTNECLSAYQRLISSYPSEPLAFRARINKARLHEGMNQASTALAIYDEITRNQAAGAAIQEAAFLRARLIGLHPELEPSNAVTNTVRVVPPPAHP